MLEQKGGKGEEMIHCLDNDWDRIRKERDFNGIVHNSFMAMMVSLYTEPYQLLSTSN